jgi:DNA excision repair protein ERCC-4
MLLAVPKGSPPQQSHAVDMAGAGVQPALAPQLLGFERQLLTELLEEDALCIVGSGLGWHKYVAVLLRMHHVAADKVLVIIGANSAQRKLLSAELKRHEPAAQPILEITNEVPAVERIDHYNSNRCCFVTTRILVVDLLSSRAQASQIAGFIVLNAHRVTDESGEGFAIRLYMQGNRQGSVKAFSDQPVSFMAGFNKVSSK